MRIENDYFWGGSNIINEDTGRPSLSQMLQSLYTVRGNTIYVDPTVLEIPDDDRDGAFGTPYETIQDALDHAKLLTATTPIVTIAIAPGTYYENLHYNGVRTVHLMANYPSEGISVDQQVEVVGSGAPPLTVTNATYDSTIAYQGSGTYSDLVSIGTAGPLGFYVSNIKFTTGEANTNAVELLGVKGDTAAQTTNFLGTNTFVFSNSQATASGTGDGIYARNAVGVTASNESGVVGGITLVNCAVLYVRRSTIVAVNISFDDSDSDGYHVYGAFLEGICTHSGFGSTATLTGDEMTAPLEFVHCQLGMALTLNDVSKVELYSSEVDKTITANGTADVTMYGGIITTINDADSIIAAGDTTGELNGVHIMGDVTMTNELTNAAWVMNGGERMGSLTDVGARWTHNLGTIGT